MPLKNFEQSQAQVKGVVWVTSDGDKRKEKGEGGYVELRGVRKKGNDVDNMDGRMRKKRTRLLSKSAGNQRGKGESAKREVDFQWFR